MIILQYIKTPYMNEQSSTGDDKEKQDQYTNLSNLYILV